MRYLVFSLVSVFTILAGTAQAQAPQKGDKALFLSNVFNENNEAFEALGLPDGSTYHVGIFTSDTLMPYASLRVIDHENGTNFGAGAGARFYNDSNSSLRTYLDAGFSYTKLEDTGGNQAANLGNTGNNATITTVGGFVGAEYLFNPNLSVGIKVGGTYSDFGDDYDFSTLDLGVSELQFNLYF